MGDPISGINPGMLVWARHRSGQSIEEVARALGKEPGVIEDWEAGNSAPTYPQLENLAYRVYKRPIALFFFPEPPDEPDPEHSFRTLPAFEIEELGPDTRFHIRDARALQLSLYDLSQGKNPAFQKIFRDLRVGPPLSAPDIADRVRSYLGIDLEIQKSWRRSDDALKAWRNAVEEKGVFVFKESLRQRDISGFCLYDEEFPVIYLNNSTAVSRQIFTLFHELAHILIQTNGVTKLDDRYIGALAGEAKRIEVFCNRFAAEFLVPRADFRRRIQGIVQADDETVSDLAGEYKVSREVILRRLRDLGLVSQEDYEKRSARWRREYEERPRGEGGGNYYATKASYLGDNYLRLAFSRYYQGRISIQQLADFLNVRASSVPGLEQIVLQKAAS